MILESSVRYQAETKLYDLGLEVAKSRNLKKVQKEIRLGFQIYAYLQALDYGVYLTKDQRDKIIVCLIKLAKLNEYPTAPVLAEFPRPNILLGTSIVTNITNNIDGGVQLEVEVDTGTESVDEIPVSTATGAVWHYTIRKALIQRSGVFVASWLSDGSDSEFYETSTSDVGGTVDVVLGFDINSGDARLRATAGSDDWVITVTRFIIP